MLIVHLNNHLLVGLPADALAALQAGEPIRLRPGRPVEEIVMVAGEDAPAVEARLQPAGYALPAHLLTPAAPAVEASAAEEPEARSRNHRTRNHRRLTTED